MATSSGAGPSAARGPVSRMLERQRQGLVQGVATLLDEGADTYWELEHRRLLWGATRDELAELLHDLDTRAANKYETGPRPVRGSSTPREAAA